MKKVISLLFLLGVSLNLWAQQSVNPSSVEMADRLRADGKIYVVVAVVLVVLLGLLVYLIRLDGRIAKVEKELKS
ncbi:MAG: CcmD family protein [Ferruginibacter sp.]|nr:CcmD family protein [Cytophagales bacterium]